MSCKFSNRPLSAHWMTHMVEVRQLVNLPPFQLRPESLQVWQPFRYFRADIFDQLFHGPPTDLDIWLWVGDHHLSIDTLHQLHPFMSLRCEQCFKLGFLNLLWQTPVQRSKYLTFLERVVLATSVSALLTLDPLSGLIQRARTQFEDMK